MKRVDGVLESDVNKNIAIKPFGTQTIVEFDELVIDYAERHPEE